MEGEALDMSRTLSSMYADLADGSGAAYIYVESVVANASPSGDDDGGAGDDDGGAGDDDGGAEATGAVLDSNDESASKLLADIELNRRKLYSAGRIPKCHGCVTIDEL